MIQLPVKENWSVYMSLNLTRSKRRKVGVKQIRINKRSSLRLDLHVVVEMCLWYNFSMFYV